MKVWNSMQRMASLSLCGCSLLLSCMMGGSAEQGNARVSGVLDGGPGGDTVLNVRLVAEGFNPFDGTGGIVCSTKTDNEGTYAFEKVPFGSYYLYAYDEGRGYVLLDGPYAFADEESRLSGATLRKASVVTVADGGTTGESSAGFYIKGTSAPEAVKVDASDLVRLNSVPAGTHDVMKHDPLSEQASFYTRNLEIFPDDSIMIGEDNRPPRIHTVSPQLPETVYVATACSLQMHASDPDSDDVTYTLLTSLDSGTMDMTSGVFSWTPTSSDGPRSRIMVKVADPYGAYSVFRWDCTVINRTQAPAPEAPDGESEWMAESTAVYTAQGIDCSASAASCRFSWGDGDTSVFSAAFSVGHAWPYPGTYEVRVQVRCDDYAQPSAWSAPLVVTVRKSRVTPVPFFPDDIDTVYGYDTVVIIAGERIIDTLYDTVSVNALPLSCASSPLYRLYRNGEALGGWTSETGFRYLPDGAGTDEFRVEAWCDTANALPSDKSEPYAVVVIPVLPSPEFVGDSLYDQESPDTLRFRITSAITINGVSVLHRVRVYNRAFAVTSDSTTRVAAMSVADTCTDAESCTDSATLYFNTYSPWFRGGNVSLVLLRPTDVYMVYLQAQFAGRVAPDEAVVWISPK